MSTAATIPFVEAKHLQCSEVWGGFETVDRPLAMPGLEGRVYSRPFNSATGGDVHYVSSCATGVFSRILLADVSGHGQSVADAASKLKKLMRRHIGHHSQGRLVRRVNREFTRMTDAGTFATAVVMTYNSHRGTLVVSNAGHPPPLRYRSTTQTWSYLHPDHEGDGPALEGLPLGIESRTNYRELEYRLDEGDVVFCYTDWLTEATNTTGAVLGFEGLMDILKTLPIEPPEQMVRRLLTAVESWTGPQASNDDVTVLLFKVASYHRRTPIGRLLMSPIRMLRTYASSYGRG